MCNIYYSHEEPKLLCENATKLEDRPLGLVETPYCTENPWAQDPCWHHGLLNACQACFISRSLSLRVNYFKWKRKQDCRGLVHFWIRFKPLMVKVAAPFLEGGCQCTDSLKQPVGNLPKKKGVISSSHRSDLPPSASFCLPSLFSKARPGGLNWMSLFVSNRPHVSF